MRGNTLSQAENCFLNNKIINYFFLYFKFQISIWHEPETLRALCTNFAFVVFISPKRATLLQQPSVWSEEAGKTTWLKRDRLCLTWLKYTKHTLLWSFFLFVYRTFCLCSGKSVLFHRCRLYVLAGSWRSCLWCVHVPFLFAQMLTMWRDPAGGLVMCASL